jgi:hypothetical protein
MLHKWMRDLATSTPVSPVGSLAPRRRALALVGESAVDWAVSAGRRMAEYALDTVPEWPGSRSDEEIEYLTQATEASALDTLAALVSGDHTLMSQSVDPAQNVAYFVRQGIPLDAVHRSVSAGQEFMTQALLDHIEALVPAEVRIATIKDMTKALFECWAHFRKTISDIYATEQVRWLNSAEGVKTHMVRRIEEGLRTDLAEARQALKYDLDQEHLGVSLWLPGVDVDTARAFDLELIVNQIATLAQSTTSTWIRRGQTRAEAWLGKAATDAAELIAAGRWPASLRITVAEPACGMAGFRLTQKQARAAMRAVRLSTSKAAVTRYRDVSLVALMTSDVDLARHFVVQTLGALNSPDPRMAELRQTLETYIDLNGSVALTSQTLHTHRNTVTYRLHQIDELLGERDDTCVRYALELAHYLPHREPDG